MLNRKQISKYITPLSPIPTSLSRSGKPQKKIKAVLFDIYGTLFISEAGDIELAGNKSQKVMQITKLLQEFGIKKSPEEISYQLSCKIQETHAYLKKKGIDFPEVKIDRLWMDLLNNYDKDFIRKFASCYELIINPVYPMPNLKELLLAYNNSNILTGIISNAQFFTPYLFNWFLNSSPEDMGFTPELIFYSYVYGYGKPSIFMFDMAAEKLKKIGISPESVLYLGNDMLKDIFPAQKVGFQTALFAGDKRSLRLRKSHPDCQNLTPDMVITDLIQLKQ